jgi:TRAP-type C4-dicarboxylate transport system substrate-binding protein
MGSIAMKIDQLGETANFNAAAGAARRSHSTTCRPHIPQQGVTRFILGPLAGSLVLSLVSLTPAAAQEKSEALVMKVSVPTINDTAHQFSKNFAAAVERDSRGRIKTEVYPASQLGSIPRQIEGVQFGTIECAVVPPEFFVGVDERFEAVAAPGLVDSMTHGQRFAADRQALELMLGLGATKGLHGVAMLMVNPNDIVTRSPMSHLADFKGKKIRVFASQFETVPFAQLGMTPVAMTLGDVLPALQQGAIDGALAGIPVLAAMHFKDAARYVIQVGQPAVFAMVEVSKKWFDTLPMDLRDIVEKDAAAEAITINPWGADRIAESYDAWTASGGELIRLPPNEQTDMLKTLSAAAEAVAKSKPAVEAAYQIVKEAAERTR